MHFKRKKLRTRSHASKSVGTVIPRVPALAVVLGGDYPRWKLS